MDAVLALMPEAERVQLLGDDRTESVLSGRDSDEAQDPGDRRGRRRAPGAYALKLLQSQGELTIASTGKDPMTGELVTQEYRVEGPVMLFLTTTAIDIDEELLNRCLVLTIDESREQTAAIQARQRAVAHAGGRCWHEARSNDCSTRIARRNRCCGRWPWSIRLPSS